MQFRPNFWMFEFLTNTPCFCTILRENRKEPWIVKSAIFFKMIVKLFHTSNLVTSIGSIWTEFFVKLIQNRALGIKLGLENGARVIKCRAIVPSTLRSKQMNTFKGVSLRKYCAKRISMTHSKPYIDWLRCFFRCSIDTNWISWVDRNQKTIKKSEIENSYRRHKIPKRNINFDGLFVVIFILHSIKYC